TDYEPLLETARTAVDRFEAHYSGRRQRRRSDAQRTFEDSIEAIFADLIHLQLTAPEGARLAVYLTKCTNTHPTRDRAPIETAVFRNTVRYLASTGWLVLQKGRDK